MARTIGPRSRPFAVRTYSARGGLDRDCLKWINSGLDGQTLNELCARLDMTRQAVSKHLGILEEANLVATVKQGREKLHYLNPVPIHDIAERWIGKFERHRLQALSELKKGLEARDE